jgi:hypothetical protein
MKAKRKKSAKTRTDVPKGEIGQHRELVLMDLFNGFECSRCKCRFPESVVPKGSSLSGSIAILQVQREFAEHVCP